MLDVKKNQEKFPHFSLFGIRKNQGIVCLGKDMGTEWENSLPVEANYSDYWLNCPRTGR